MLGAIAHARAGGDNPDQRYLSVPVRGGTEYRLWGRLGSATRVEVRLYAVTPWSGNGHSAGYLTYEEIEVAEDGSFSVRLSPESEPGSSALHIPDDAATVWRVSAMTATGLHCLTRFPGGA